MKNIIYKDYAELSFATAQMIAEIIRKKPNALLCLPAGETSIGTFQNLIELQNNSEVDFCECRIVGLDEWVGLGNRSNESCYNFLKLNLFNYLNIKNENICFFNGESDDLLSECIKTDRFINDNDGIDLMLLGIGMNGHIGLNEPGVSPDKYSNIVELDEVTKKVGQKYFSTEVNLSKGITLGIQSIMESRTVLLQAKGANKKHIVQKLINTSVINSFPVSYLKLHPNSYLLVDSEAAFSENE